MSFSRNFVFVGAAALLTAGLAGAQQQTPPARQSQQQELQQHQAEQGSQSRGSANRSTLTAPDQKFMMDTAKGGHHEVEFAQMGVSQATNKSVKEFARKLIDDHTKANDELKTLAQQKSVTLPSTYPKEPSHNKLSGMSGVAFDREFMRMAIADHQKDIAAFEKQANSGADADVKNFASKTLPTLRSHLDQAKSLKP